MNYQEDITIITTSKEFRRMQDKTQLFYARKSDHYRTRLTHTLEVCDIALQIAEKFRNKCKEKSAEHANDYFYCNNLNDKLITAIAYGHDIGHTPFGHIGERILSNILDGTDNLGGLINTNKILKQCFKHNINSFRILQKIEKNDSRKEKISWQTLDGVLKHTKVYKSIAEYKHLKTNEKKDPYQIKKAGSNGVLSGGQPQFNSLKNIIVAETNKKFDYYKHNYALTIEGQIVALADEIAQRISDFDDAVRAGLWKPSMEDFILNGKPIKFYDIFNNCIKALNDDKCSKDNVSKICVNLREFLIDHVEFFPDKMDINTFMGEQICLGKCIDFDAEGNEANQIFNQINRDYILKCNEIRKCDGISKHVIRQIFKAYYNDFSQLSDSCINMLYSDLIKRSDSLINNGKIKSLSLKKEKFNIKDLLNIKDIGKKIIFINAIKNACLDKVTNFDNKLGKANNIFSDLLNELTKEKGDVKKNSANDIDFESEWNLRKKWLPELHSIILRNIVFFIAGMTDGFTRDEYQRLYSIKMPMNVY